MAIQTCPNCGKKISDRSAACPFCDAPVGVQEKVETLSIDVVSKKFQMIEIASAGMLTTIVFVLWRLVACALLGMFGDMMQTAFLAASALHMWKSILLLVIGAVLFYIAPLILKWDRKTLNIILTIAICLLHFVVILLGTILPYAGSTREEINIMATVINRALIFVYGLVVPLFQGSLSLVSCYHGLRKALVRQGVCTGLFIIFSTLFMWCGMWVFELGGFASTVPTLIAAVVGFIVALFMATQKNKTT